MEKLRAVDEELLASLDVLAGLIARPEFDLATLSGARYRIAKAVAERRKRVTSLFEEFGHDPLVDSKYLQQMLDANIAMRVRYTTHVGHWAPARIVEGWQGYCRAASSLIVAMRAQIEEQKRVFYPRLMTA